MLTSTFNVQFFLGSGTGNSTGGYIEAESAESIAELITKQLKETGFYTMKDYGDNLVVINHLQLQHFRILPKPEPAASKSRRSTPQMF